MNGRDLAELVFKIWGAVVLATVLTTMPADLIFLYTFDDFESGPFTIIPIVRQVLLGVGLIVLAGPISRFIIPVRGELALVVSTTEIRLLSFVLMGIWLVVHGSAEIFNTYFGFSIGESNQGLSFWAYLSSPGYEGIFWNGVIDVLVGLWLFFGRQSVERLWSGSRGIRQPGTGD